MRQLLAEPRVPNAPVRVWRDWVVVSLLVAAAAIEAMLRTDISWKYAALLLGVVQISSSLWRRTHPLPIVFVVFASHAASEAFTVLGAKQAGLLYASGAAVVLVPYALSRWGSGREIVIGLAFIVFGHLPLGQSAVNGFEDIVGIIVVLLFPAALGAAVRYRSSARIREIDQIKLREREQLARELHDTVAHHVSAIIIQAQAGRTVAATHPDVAVNVLEVIEREATKTLAEMRIMVGALRQTDTADLAPERRAADVVGLAREGGETPSVNVRLSGSLDDLRPPVGAAVYRLAQESVTNAIRHARHATTIEVSVLADAECVRLSVRDDGDLNPFGGGAGYGIIGMTERVNLLGGSLVAGPGLERGWTITAVLPRKGSLP